MPVVNLLGDIVPRNTAQGLTHPSTLCYFKRNKYKLIKEQRESHSEFAEILALWAPWFTAKLPNKSFLFMTL